jgi:hypothetical protein
VRGVRTACNVGDSRRRVFERAGRFGGGVQRQVWAEGCEFLQMSFSHLMFDFFLLFAFYISSDAGSETHLD